MADSSNGGAPSRVQQTKTKTTATTTAATTAVAAAAATVQSKAAPSNIMSGNPGGFKTEYKKVSALVACLVR